jgi:hypothetical protein
MGGARGHRAGADHPRHASVVILKPSIASKKLGGIFGSAGRRR